MKPALNPYTKALATVLGAAPVLLLGQTVDETTFSLIASPAIMLVGGLWWWNTRKAMRADTAQRRGATAKQSQPSSALTAPGTPSGSARPERSTAVASRNVGRSRAGGQQHGPN
jgi:hypothetical protein